MVEPVCDYNIDFKTISREHRKELRLNGISTSWCLCLSLFKVMSLLYVRYGKR